MIKTLTYPSHTIASTINIDGLSSRFEHMCLFESNAAINPNDQLNYDRILALGASSELVIKQHQNAFKKLQKFVDANKGWTFGYLSYDLKNETEGLSSGNHDRMEFSLIHFFAPLLVIRFGKENISLHFNDEFISETEADSIYQLAISSEKKSGNTVSLKIHSAITKENYLSSVQQLKQHIQQGDIYEVNFCQEFYASGVIDPAFIFEKLNAISGAPFSVFAKTRDHYLLCASPERFLQKTGITLRSQPIKGTTRRSFDPKEDEILKRDLHQNEKERSENIMIVDLVRNDLSRIAKRGSVLVEELCKVYSYKQVHQLISSVKCELKDTASFSEIIQNTFPMGSMTGAPKVKAMELIEKYESTKRGLYSGAIGYIDPEGNFDFNVVIRSILYNSATAQLSFMVGSAITDKSEPIKEYEECMLKAKAMFEVLQG
ncbi:MAG: anthranilate synthase component I family protein [Bacteroidota bacterium]|nr:anthranilate synthase component I family protein [Bacteroidota bacterium]